MHCIWFECLGFSCSLCKFLSHFYSYLEISWNPFRNNQQNYQANSVFLGSNTEHAIISNNRILIELKFYKFIDFLKENTHYLHSSPKMTGSHVSKNDWFSCFAQILGVHSWLVLKRVAFLNSNDSIKTVTLQHQARYKGAYRKIL